MIEGPPDHYQVAVYGPDEALLAESPAALYLPAALSFVESAIIGKYSGHFHWEDQSCRPRLEQAIRKRLMTESAQEG